MTQLTEFKFNPVEVNDRMTVTSLEELEAINYIRKQESELTGEPYKELTHADFMKKIRKVLGEENSQQLKGVYITAQNKEMACYYLPKREAELMLMSESYKIQAKVYDMLQLALATLKVAEEVIEDAGLNEEYKAKLEENEEIINLQKQLLQAKDSIIQLQAGKVIGLTSENVKLKDEVNPFTGLSAGWHTLGAIHKDQKWKSCPQTIRKLLEEYGYEHKGNHKRYYDLHPTLQAMAWIVAVSNRIGEGRLEFHGIRYDWFVIKPK